MLQIGRTEGLLTRAPEQFKQISAEVSRCQITKIGLAYTIRHQADEVCQIAARYSKILPGTIGLIKIPAAPIPELNLQAIIFAAGQLMPTTILNIAIPLENFKLGVLISKGWGYSENTILSGR
jgi:hypothetical protein